VTIFPDATRTSLFSTTTGMVAGAYATGLTPGNFTLPLEHKVVH
jgi:hypothetical protein